MNKEVKEKFRQNAENMEFYDQDGTQDTTRPTFTSKRFANKNHKPRAPKIKPTTYSYTSDNPEDCFFDVLDKLCDSCHIVETFVGDSLSTYTDEEIGDFTSDDYVTAITKHAVNDCMPRLLEGKYIHSMVSVSTSRLYIKTEGNIAFAIDFKYAVENKKATLTSCTGSITLYAKNDTLVNDLLDNGFEEVQKR